MSPQPAVNAPPALPSDRRLIEEVQRDVCRAFPGLPALEVGAVVEHIWAQYDEARIRDFVPVLVGKQAHEELRAALGSAQDLARCTSPPCTVIAQTMSTSNVIMIADQTG